VAHACIPSYSGGRDQEDHSLKPAQANSLRDSISKIPNTKRAGGVAQGIGPEFKPWYGKKKKKKAATMVSSEISFSFLSYVFFFGQYWV
jgi:hypothetical protein